MINTHSSSLLLLPSCAFSPCTVPLFQHRSFPRAAVPQGLHQHSSCRKSQPVPAQVSPLSGVCVSAPHRCKRMQKNTCSDARSASSLLLTCWCSHCCFLTVFFHYPSHCYAMFYPLLNMLSQRCHQLGSVVSYNGSAVESAVFGTGQSLTFSHRGHL